MGKMTEMIAYVNSTTEDWQKPGGMKLEQYHYFTIDYIAKKVRRVVQYDCKTSKKFLGWDKKEKKDEEY